MKDPTPISRAPPSPVTLNYADLLRDGIKRSQELSGDLWTDYNEHDPGVTILQALCFALTDLGYRTAHPTEDILASSGDAQDVSTESQALFTGNKILGCAPFTANDYRKLIYDAVDGVKNAWLEPVPTDTEGKRGLYRVLVQTFPPAPDSQDSPSAREQRNSKIVADVWKLLKPKRNVGENFASVTLVRERELELDAEIEIDPESNPEDLVADVLFGVEMSLNPPPEIQDVDTALQRGVPPDRLFEGPGLSLGAISDDSLKDLRNDAPFEQVMETILSVDGVLAVNTLRITPTDEDTEQAKSAQTVVPVFSRTIAKICVLRGGVKVDVNRERVLSSLAHREQRRRWDVNYAQKRMEDVAYGRVPLGDSRRHLSRYRSIQHLFPAVYGIGRYGVGEGASTIASGGDNRLHGRQQRQVEARQLKAYLLLFEQLLADYLAQLEYTARLFSCEELTRTYVCQVLVQSGAPTADDPPEIALVLGGESDKGRVRAARSGDTSNDWFYRYEKGLEAITAAHDPVLDRRERALDHLLARFNERFDDARMQQLSAFTPDRRDEFLERRIKLKRRFLSDYVRLSADRSLGLDLSETDLQKWGRLLSGLQRETALQKRVRLLTGLTAPLLVEHILLGDAKEPEGIGRLTVGTDFRIPERRAIWIGDTTFRVQAVVDRKDSVADFVRRLAVQGADKSNYCIYPPGAYRVSLRLHGGDGVPGIEFVQPFAAAGEAELTIQELVALFRGVQDGSRSPYELIRPAWLPHDFFAQRVSAFFPADAAKPDVAAAGSASHGQDFRKFVELTLGQNLPAHLALDCFWLERDEIASFSKDYADWMEAKRLLHTTPPPAPVRELDAGICSGKLRTWIHKLHCRRVLRERATLRAEAAPNKSTGTVEPS